MGRNLQNIYKTNLEIGTITKQEEVLKSLFSSYKPVGTGKNT
jgi:hypothetical protein